MSKIVTIFSQPNTGTHEHSVSDKTTSMRALCHKLYATDVTSFERASQVADIFGAIEYYRHMMDVTAFEDHVYDDLLDSPEHDAMVEAYQELTSILGSPVMETLEVTDSQWEYLENSNKAMEVLKNNMVVAVDTLSWKDDDVVQRQESVSNLFCHCDAYNQLMEDAMSGFEEEFYEDDSYSDSFYQECCDDCPDECCDDCPAECQGEYSEW